MRCLLVLVLGVAACGASLKPNIHFAGDPQEPLAPTTASALTALVGGEIAIDGSWSACSTKHPLLEKGDKEVRDCESAASTLTVTCEPACATERRNAEKIVVHPPGAGRLVVTATTARDSTHEKLSETRIYDVVVPEDIGLLCRDIHGNVQECDVPNDARGTVEVVAYLHGKIIERLGGVQIDGKELGGGAVFVSDVVDVHAPGPHTVVVTGGGLTKKTVIAVAAEAK